MGAFVDQLADLQPPSQEGRRWVYVPYDQLHPALGVLGQVPPERLGIALVECPAKAARRPYHRQKLALILANQRHFALEQARRGVAVRHVVHAEGFGPALVDLARELGPLEVARPAERELRVELAPLARAGAVRVRPHDGWLTDRALFRQSHSKGPPFRMDAFYRAVRRHHDVLMEDGRPAGGRFSHDGDNRQPWPGDPPAPEPPRFALDPIKEEVGALVEARFADHPGSLDLDHLPATAADAEAAWAWFLEHCLSCFGPYEDAFSTRSSGLFHARIGALLNLHRLLPARVVADVEAADVPLSSKEGFLRQVWGWREFVRHVHDATDGLRRGYEGAPQQGPPWTATHAADLPVAVPAEDGEQPAQPEPPGDDEGWAALAAASREAVAQVHADSGAAPTHLGPGAPLPPVFWGGAPSGLACLDGVVADVWREGWSHHITRLMVLSNLATLLDLSPRELTDWFWVAYVDAFDWVVEPNVLAMGTFAAGELMTTKPYVSGAAYLDRMGDACADCAFHPKRSCPITPLYWAFLERHREPLEGGRRLTMPYASLKRRSPERRDLDRRTFEAVADRLAAGERLTPAWLAEALS